MKVKSEVIQSCLTTLSDSMDCSLPGSSVHGIFQARALEWGAIAFSIPLLYKKQQWLVVKLELTHFPQMKMKAPQSCPTLCDSMDCNPQASLSMGFSRQNYRSGLPFPSPGDLPNPGVKPCSSALQIDFLLSEPQGSLSLKIITY